MRQARPMPLEPLRCFARASLVPRGCLPLRPQVHHQSCAEHFCGDRVAHYGQGDARRVWQEEQERGGKCGLKELVVRLHLPIWRECSICGKWRSVSASAPEVVGEWHCGLWEPPAIFSGYGTRRGGGACAQPEEAAASAAEPPEGPARRDGAAPGAARRAGCGDGGGGRAAPTVVAAVGGGGGGISRHGARGVPAPLPRAAQPAALAVGRGEGRPRDGAAIGWARVADARRRLHAPGLRAWCAARCPPSTAPERLGLISFGACRQLRLTIRPPSVPIKTVIVVGAGIAGLAARRCAASHRVVVLEAQRVAGGRVRTEELEGRPVDLGAMIIAGTQGNPLLTLARQVGATLHTLDQSTCPPFDGTAPLDSGSTRARRRRSTNDGRRSGGAARRRRGSAAHAASPTEGAGEEEATARRAAERAAAAVRAAAAAEAAAAEAAAGPPPRPPPIGPPTTTRRTAAARAA